MFKTLRHSIEHHESRRLEGEVKPQRQHEQAPSRARLDPPPTVIEDPMSTADPHLHRDTLSNPATQQNTHTEADVPPMGSQPRRSRGQAKQRLALSQEGTALQRELQAAHQAHRGTARQPLHATQEKVAQATLSADLNALAAPDTVLARLLHRRRA